MVRVKWLELWRLDKLGEFLTAGRGVRKTVNGLNAATVAVEQPSLPLSVPCWVLFSSFYEFGVPFEGVLIMKPLLLGAHRKAPDFGKISFAIGGSLPYGR